MCWPVTAVFLVSAAILISIVLVREGYSDNVRVVPARMFKMKARPA